MLEQAKYAEIKTALVKALRNIGYTVVEVDGRSKKPSKISRLGHDLWVHEHDMCDTLMIQHRDWSPIADKASGETVKFNRMNIPWISVGFHRFEKTKQLEVFVRSPDLSEGSSPNRSYQKIYTGIWMRANSTSTVDVPTITFNGGKKMCDVVGESLTLITESVAKINEGWDQVAEELLVYQRACEQQEYLKYTKGTEIERTWVNAGGKAAGTKSLADRPTNGAESVRFETDGRTQSVTIKLGKVLCQDDMGKVIAFAATL